MNYSPKPERLYTDSLAQHLRASEFLPHGTASPHRNKAPIPLHIKDAFGCRLFDVDDNEYIDYLLGWGPLILGHRHPAIVDALSKQAQCPHLYGAQHHLEYDVAKKLCNLIPCAKRIAFTSSGTEAVQLAMRLARAHTQRELTIKMEGHYHGWSDTALVSYHPTLNELSQSSHPEALPESLGQVKNSTKNFVVCQWNDLPSVKRAFDEHEGKIAAVIMEPVLCNSGCLMPVEGYLQGVRKLCIENDSLLIFDEVITGFRIALGGAQSELAVTPDLATFGKALGGGMPLSAVAGSGEIIDRIGTGANDVNFGGTFNGNPMSLAAAYATLVELENGDGVMLKRIKQSGFELMEKIRRCAIKHNVPLRVEGFGSAFALHFTEAKELLTYRDVLGDDKERLKLFVKSMLDHGINILPGGRFYVSAAHQEQDLAETIRVVDDVLSTLSV